MPTHQNAGRKTQSETSNKKAMDAQATGGNMATKKVVQAKAAYPSPAKTPPAKSPTLLHEYSEEFQDDEETPSHHSGTNYKDFTLFPETFSEYDSYNFFPEIDASVKENNGSVFSYNGTAREEPANSQNNPKFPYDPVYAAASNSDLVASHDSIYETITNYETRSYANYSNTNALDYMSTPLGAWEYTFERHESLAYRFEQPPYSTKRGEEH